MTEKGTDNSGADGGAADPGDPGADQSDRAGGFDRRAEEWILRLRDEAEQRAPEVLTGLAATAKGVATYLEDMADQVRAKREQEATDPDPAEDAGSASQELSGSTPEQPADSGPNSTS